MFISLSENFVSVVPRITPRATISPEQYMIGFQGDGQLRLVRKYQTFKPLPLKLAWENDTQPETLVPVTPATRDTVLLYLFPVGLLTTATIPGFRVHPQVTIAPDGTTKLTPELMAALGMAKHFHIYGQGPYCAVTSSNHGRIAPQRLPLSVLQVILPEAIVAKLPPVDETIPPSSAAEISHAQAVIARTLLAALLANGAECIATTAVVHVGQEAVRLRITGTLTKKPPAKGLRPR